LSDPAIVCEDESLEDKSLSFYDTISHSFGPRQRPTPEADRYESRRGPKNGKQIVYNRAPYRMMPAQYHHQPDPYYYSEVAAYEQYQQQFAPRPYGKSYNGKQPFIPRQQHHFWSR